MRYAFKVIIIFGALSAVLALGSNAFAQSEIKIDFSGIFSEIKDAAIKVLQEIGEMFKRIWRSIRDFFQGIWNWLKNIWEQTLDKEIERRRPIIKKDLQEDIEGLKTAITGFLKSFWQKIFR